MPPAPPWPYQPCSRALCGPTGLPTQPWSNARQRCQLSSPPSAGAGEAAAAAWAGATGRTLAVEVGSTPPELACALSASHAPPELDTAPVLLERPQALAAWVVASKGLPGRVGCLGGCAASGTVPPSALPDAPPGAPDGPAPMPARLPEEGRVPTEGEGEPAASPVSEPNAEVGEVSW